MKENRHEALFWRKLDNGRIGCELCPHRCKLSEGQRGFCNVRGVHDGKLYSLYYGMVATGGQVDPVEKKPLFHFYPGSKVLSFGGISCNLRCDHCQNESLSQEYDHRLLMPITLEQIIKMARETGCKGVAWTYNEPTIHFETYYHWSKALKEQGFYTVWVTNGYINPEPFAEIAKFLDATNIDVKAFTEEFYRKYTKSSLHPVLEICALSCKLKVHTELTYLIIPTLNDTLEEIGKYLDWVETTLGYDVPLHFSSFHPAHRMAHFPPTPRESVIEAVELAIKREFHYVYAGNLYHNSYENTRCPSCQQVVIQRAGYTIQKIAVDAERRCQFCKERFNVVV
jgi:pyruvate formate lyase activating enzyme